MKLKGKVALITGAGSGMGRATSILFAKEGAKVAVIDIDSAGGRETVRVIRDEGGDAVFIEADVSKAADAQKMVKATVEKYGKLDILFNNAGVLHKFVPMIDLTEEEWDRVININLKGIFLGSKYAIPEMRKTGGGIIINTASIAGAFIGIPEGYSGYCASKAGVVGLTRAMALECLPYNIRVNCICPGDILTPMCEGEIARDAARTGKRPEDVRRAYAERNPIGRLGKPEEIARIVLFLSSDESSFVVGSIFVADGGKIISSG